MKYVLTLVGNPADAAVSSALVQISAALTTAGARLAAPDWLAPKTAVDLPFEGLEPTAARDVALTARANAPVDIAAQSASERRKRLLVADMDSTIIAIETIDELADAVGKREEVARLTELAMQGKLVYAETLRQRVALLKGIPLSELARVYTERVRFNPGARTLIASMRAQGTVTCLISGGFTYFVERVAAEAGFDLAFANELGIAGELLTGTVREPILDGIAKRSIFERVRDERGLSPDSTMAVGDGANDRGLIEAAGLGVAYRAKPALAAIADVRLDHADLTALLYFQGYRAQDIVVAG